MERQASAVTLPQTFREAYALYERHRLRNSAASTRLHFGITCARMDRFLGRPALVSDLTDDLVADQMAAIIRAGRSPRTANKFRDNVLAVWRFLARKGIVDVWPDVEPLTEPKRVPVAWTREQLAKLWWACDMQRGFIGGVHASLWWHGLHALAWDTGERISAVVSVAPGDFDLPERWVNIRAEMRKGKREDKLSRLHPDTAAVFAQIIADDRPRVFPWPYTKSYLWYRYDRLLKRAGLPHDRWHKFHCLRKSAASYFEAAGGNATELLGHADARMTAKYLDPRICAQQQAADLLFRPVEAPETPAGQLATTDGIAEMMAAYVAETKTRVTKRRAAEISMRLHAAIEGVGINKIGELSAEKLTAWVAKKRAKELSAFTLEEYRTTLLTFITWIANRTRHPVASQCAAELTAKSQRGKAGAA